MRDHSFFSRDARGRWYKDCCWRLAAAAVAAAVVAVVAAACGGGVAVLVAAAGLAGVLCHAPAGGTNIGRCLCIHMRTHGFASMQVYMYACD